MRIFIRKQCWVLSDAFAASIEMAVSLFSFILLMLYITLFGFSDNKPTLHSWENCHFSHVVLCVLKKSLDSIYWCLEEHFCIYVGCNEEYQYLWRILVCHFVFLNDVLVMFLYQGYADILEWINKCFTLPVFWVCVEFMLFFMGSSGSW